MSLRFFIALQNAVKHLQGKHSITHHLHQYYDEIKSYKRKKDFLNSPFYKKHKIEIVEVIDGVEWDNTISDIEPKDHLRIVSWNIERGKQIDGIIQFFKEDEHLSKADVIIAVEVDNGMGRTNNRNISKELAESLGMNYCFTPSYLVLGKGALGETNHDVPNTESLHGTAILSKYPILYAQGVKVPPVKEVFHSSEKRLGVKKGIVAELQVGSKSVAVGGIHIDLSSTETDRANQMKALLGAFPTADVQVVGGDFNCSTFNLRNKAKVVSQIFKKFFTIGFTKSIEHYMTPELKYDKPLFDVIEKMGFSFQTYNDRSIGTLYFDINDMLTNDKSKNFVPKWLLNELHRRVKPWNGCVPLKLDWLAGKGAEVVTAKTIKLGKQNGIMLSDHNPIYVDLKLV